MKEIDPSFNLWVLEEDAMGIFLNAYNHFLKGDLTTLESLCSDTALGYFRVLLKKQEAEKSEPKYKELWQIERAYLSQGQVLENGMPVFTFTVKCQEVYCLVHKIDGSLVDGDEDRIMSYEYLFAITPNFEMDVELVGHSW